jgi:hypothetical protein
MIRNHGDHAANERTFSKAIPPPASEQSLSPASALMVAALSISFALGLTSLEVAVPRSDRQLKRNG